MKLDIDKLELITWQSSDGWSERITNVLGEKFYFFKNKKFDFKVPIDSDAKRCYFESCYFEKGLIFGVPAGSSDGSVSRKFNFDIFIINSSVDSFFDLSGCEFEKNVRIHNCEIHNASEELLLKFPFFKFGTDFNNTKFNGLVDFWNTKFKVKTIFYKTDFNSTAVFSMASFEQDVLFTYSLLGAKSIFAKTEFQKGLDLSQAIISGKLQLFDIHFKNENFDTDFFKESEKHLYQDAIDHGKTCIDYNLEKDQCNEYKTLNIPIENKVHTFQILRKAFEDVGNYNDATIMRRIEKTALREYNQRVKNVKVRTKDNNWLKKIWNWIKSAFYLSWRDFFTNDGFILLLNRLSNNYRTSFWRGIFFTAIIASVFTSLTLNVDPNYNLSFKPSDIKWKQLIIFLNPAHDIKDLIPKPSGWSYFFDYLGRIFVGYGIYQTVQAFRKFK